MHKKLWEYDEQLEEVLNEDRYPVAEEVLEPENGYLIAAAPEMYEIVAKLEDMAFSGGAAVEDIQILIQRAMFVAKKARGEK